MFNAQHSAWNTVCKFSINASYSVIYLSPASVLFVLVSHSEMSCIYKIHLSISLCIPGAGYLYLVFSIVSTVLQVQSMELCLSCFFYPSCPPAQLPPDSQLGRLARDVGLTAPSDCDPVTYFLLAPRSILFFSTQHSNLEDVSQLSPRPPLLISIWLHLYCIFSKLSHVEELSLVHVLL